MWGLSWPPRGPGRAGIRAGPACPAKPRVGEGCQWPWAPTSTGECPAAAARGRLPRRDLLCGLGRSLALSGPLFPCCGAVPRNQITQADFVGRQPVAVPVLVRLCAVSSPLRRHTWSCCCPRFALGKPRRRDITATHPAAPLGRGGAQALVPLPGSRVTSRAVPVGPLGCGGRGPGSCGLQVLFVLLAE